MLSYNHFLLTMKIRQNFLQLCLVPGHDEEYGNHVCEPISLWAGFEFHIVLLIDLQLPPKTRESNQIYYFTHI